MINDEAIECFNKNIELEPRYYIALLDLAIAHSKKGDNRLALSYTRRLEELVGKEPFVLMQKSCFKAALNEKGISLNLLKELKSVAEHRSVPPTYFAFIYYYHRNAEKALYYLEEAHQARDPFILYLLIWPRPEAPSEAINWHDRFFSDPRVQAIKKKAWPD